MPLFNVKRQQAPRGIAQAIATMLSSSGELSADDRMQVEQAAANVGYRSALADKARAEVEAMRSGAAYRENPQTEIEAAALAAGIPAPRVAAYMEHLLRGGEAPADLSPEAQRAIRSSVGAARGTRFATAPTNAQQMTQAGSNLLADAVRGAIAGTPNVAEQNQLKAALPGAGYREPFSGLDANGQAINQETGETIQTALTGAVENLRRQQAFEREQAGVSHGRKVDETIRHNRATEGLTARGQNMTDARARDTQARERWVNDIARGIQINMATGETRPITVNGAPVPPRAATEKPLTEAQGRAQMFGTRAAEADAVLSALEEDISLVGLAAKRAVEGVPGVGMAANKALSPEQQKVEQAQRNFVNAVLRQESGAVISDAEFANAQKQYFPQPGDSKAVIEQKRANRQSAIEGFKTMSGPAGARIEAARGASGSWGDRRADPSAPRAQGERRAPAVGAVVDGYRFKGGDPSRPQSWERVQ